MSRLVDFYRGEATDTEGRLLAEIWEWQDSDLEQVHDFIQWLFPLSEPSAFNRRAPLLTKDDVAAFRKDERLRANLGRSFERILKFLGLARTADGQIVEGPNFAARAPDVWSAPNHNWLRITRVLRSLGLLGLGQEAAALFDRLSDFKRSGRFPIGEDTFRYWTEAVRSS